MNALAPLSLNGDYRTETLPVARKPRSQKKPALTAKPTAPKAKRVPEAAWAHGYVIGAALTSCYLNALAFGQAAPEGQKWAAWTLGVLIPAGVLALGRWASLLYIRDRRTLAVMVGSVAAALLVLSLWHCTESVALLTGSPLPLAACMAIAVDAGMAACEVSVTLAGRR